MLPHMKSSLAIVAVVATNSMGAVADNTTCYDRHGNSRAVNMVNGAFVPCLADTTETHCCAAGETCLSNGLCFVSADASLNTGTCVDPNWGTPCLQFCNQYAFATLYRCGDGNWCCSNEGNVTSCCQDGAEPFKILGRALVGNGTAFIAGYELVAIDDGLSNNDTQNNSNGTGAAQPSGSTCASSSDSPNTMAVGLGAGLGVGVPLLLAVAALAYLLQKERRKSRSATTRGMPMSSVDYSDRQPPAWSTPSKRQQGDVCELSSESRAELSGLVDNRQRGNYG